MQFVIVRKYLKTQTIGRLYFLNEKLEIPFQCFTLELPWSENKRNVSCIPEGKYAAIKHISPKFGETFWLQGVKNRSEILVHSGNFNWDTLGCILVGSGLKDLNGDGKKDLINSKKTLKELYKMAPSKVKFSIFREC